MSCAKQLTTRDAVSVEDSGSIKESCSRWGGGLISPVGRGNNLRGKKQPVVKYSANVKNG